MQEMIVFYETSRIVTLYATANLRIYVDNSSITIFVESLFQYYLLAHSAVSKVVTSLQISCQILISPMFAAFFTRLF